MYTENNQKVITEIWEIRDSRFRHVVNNSLLSQHFFSSLRIIGDMAKSRIAIFSNLSDNFLFIFSARLVGFVNFVFRKYKGNRYWPTNLDFPFKFHILNFWSMSIFWNTPTRISKIQNYANLKSIPFFIWWSVRVNFSSMSEIRSNTAVLHSLRGSHDSS